MKVFLFLTLFPFFIFGQSTSKKNRQLLLSISGSETTDADYILNHVENFKFQKYIHGKGINAVLKNFGVVVHETCHELNSLIGEAQENPDFKGYNGYFITQDVKISLLHADVFNARELNKFVPKDYQKIIFRYGTYVGDPKKGFWVSSQYNGVYGMVDEFAAYYHGTKARLELYDYYKKRSNEFKKEQEWINYLTNISANYYAYYEFKLFISWYLQYAQLHHPKTYTQLMNDTKLRLAYTLVDDEFSALIEEYYAIQKKVISNLNTPETKVSIIEKGGKTWILFDSENEIFRQGIQDYEAFYLANLLESDEHNILDSFRIEGATIENYRRFLPQE